jgi:hypothetical protein
MTINRKDGVIIETGLRIENIDGPWGVYGCTIWLTNGQAIDGQIEGDGHMFAEETLADEGGTLI